MKAAIKADLKPTFSAREKAPELYQNLRVVKGRLRPLPPDLAFELGDEGLETAGALITNFTPTD